MKFYDTVRISIHSGKGWDGVVAARREAKVPFGGPAGGNGGKWGSVYFVWSKDENTLLKYTYHRDYKADYGAPGEWKDKYWADADDLYLSVPLGTVVKNADTGAILHQITEDKEERRALRWGDGWVGNMHFKTSTMQYPQFALLGEPAQSLNLLLELQLLGDVALIGTPSVGKSTLINACSNAKAKVAAYHFTTLVPNLWMVHYENYDFTMVDIPGLIAGAHEGKWLGNDFLRHILKAHIFCFVHDLSLYESGMDDSTVLLDEIIAFIKETYVGSDSFGDPIDDVEFVLEIVNGHPHLKVYLIRWNAKKLFLDKLLCFVFNKYDLVYDDEIVGEYQQQFDNRLKAYFLSTFWVGVAADLLEKTSFVLSGATRHGLDAWLHFLTAKLRSYEFAHESILDLVEGEVVVFERIVDITDQEIDLLIERGYLENPDKAKIKVWQINDEAIIKAAFITMWGNEQGEHWFWRKMESNGFAREAEEAGIRYGDIIKVPKGSYDVPDDRYIQWML